MRDQDRKRYLADLADRYVKRRIGRRDFMRAAGQLGLGLQARSAWACHAAVRRKVLSVG